ncbi:hypothetical protein H0H87_005961, partial [Tephrocybe sp. NHM501043]
MSAYNWTARIPVLFRTYASPKEPSILCTVWQAAQATSALPGSFEPALIGPPFRQEQFIDGGVGRSNPVMQVLEEAKLVFPERTIACVVSIGTGKLGTIGMGNKNSKFFENEMISDYEEMAQLMEQIFKDVENTYFRFNVEQGLQGVRHGDLDKMPSVYAHTRNYMLMHEVNVGLDTAIKVIRERRGRRPTSNI